MGVACHYIPSPTTFTAGDVFSTADGQIGALHRLTSTLQFTSDGALVLTHRGHETWRRPEKGGGSSASFQENGDLVVYDPHGKALWTSGTYGHKHSLLVLDELGNLTMRDQAGHTVWQANLPSDPVMSNPYSRPRMDPDGAWWSEATQYDASASAVPVAGGMDNWTTACGAGNYLTLLAQSQATFVTHCPIDKDFIAACHRIGVRCFPYVSFWFGTPWVKIGGNAPTDALYQGVRWDDHHDWYQQTAPGSYAGAYFHDDGVGIQVPPGPAAGADPSQHACLTCPNTEDYQQAMLRWVEYVMQQGADGIFIDGVTLGNPPSGGHQGHQPCYAPHEHIFASELQGPDPTVPQNSAYALLLRRAREVVLRYRPDGKLIGNTGGPLNSDGRAIQDVTHCLDAEMIEGFLGETPGQPPTINGQPAGRACQRLQGYLAAGGRVLAHGQITGPSATKATVRQHAFLLYAASAVWGLVWLDSRIGWPGLRGSDYPPKSPGAPPADDQTGDLPSLNLGRPHEDGRHLVSSEQAWREFDFGFVAVNLDLTAPLSVPVPDRFAGRPLTDECTGLAAVISNGAVTIPPNSGRAFSVVPFVADPAGSDGKRYGVGVSVS